MKLFSYFGQFLRLIWLLIWEPLSFWNGSRRLRKWVKKNKREQDPNLHPLDERWTYIRKKVKAFNRRMGIKINVIGDENIPKGAAWITPNHTSNFDGFYLIDALGSKSKLVAVAKHKLKEKKMSNGYLIAADSVFLDRSNPRNSLTTLNNVANYAKKNNRGVVLFPEGTRSLTTELLEFKCGSFKFAQKYALPIVPVTITGTIQARGFVRFKKVQVNIIVHKPIKPINHIKLPTNILCKNIREQIQKELVKYEKGLSPKELKEFNILKKKSVSKEKAKNKKLEKEIVRGHDERSKNNIKKGK